MATPWITEQTDIWHDRDRLIRSLATARGRDRKAYQAAIDRLDREEELRAREAAQSRELGAQHANLQENIRARGETARQQALDREARARETAQYHADVVAGQKETRERENRQQMLALLPELPPDSPMRKQIVDSLLASGGLNTNTAPTTTNPADEQAKAFAAKQAAAGKGPPPTTQPAVAGPQTPAPATGEAQQPAPAGGGAPPYSPGAGLVAPTRNLVGTRWMAGTGGVSGGNNAQMIKYYDDGSSEVVPATSTGEESPTLGPVQRNVEAGRITGPLANQIPAGYDLNTNTGEMVPQSNMGTINGVPSDVAVARGAAKTGITPVYSSPRTWDLYQKTLAQAKDIAPFAGKPTVETGPGGLVKTGAEGAPVPKPAGVGEVGQPPGLPGVANEQQGFFGRLFAPAGLVGKTEPPSPGQTTQPTPVPVEAPGAPKTETLAGGLVGPTPAGKPVPALGITKFENAPLPTPAGTPPAYPTPPQLTPEEEERRRQLAIQQ